MGKFSDKIADALTMSHGSCAYLELPTKLTHINTATTCIHDRAVAIRFGAISLVVCVQERCTVRVSGGMLPQENFEI